MSSMPPFPVNAGNVRKSGTITSNKAEIAFNLSNSGTIKASGKLSAEQKYHFSSLFTNTAIVPSIIISDICGKPVPDSPGALMCERL